MADAQGGTGQARVWRWGAALLLVGLLSACRGASSGAGSTAVAGAPLPAVVEGTWRARHPGARAVGNAEEAGGALFRVDLEEGARRWSLVIDAAGALREIRSVIRPSELPQPVRAALLGRTAARAEEVVFDPHGASRVLFRVEFAGIDPDEALFFERGGAVAIAPRGNAAVLLEQPEQAESDDGAAP